MHARMHAMCTGSKFARRLRATACAAVCILFCAAAIAADFQALLAHAAALRRDGELDAAASALLKARMAAADSEAADGASVALGAVLLQASRLDEADAALATPHERGTPRWRAAAALERGNVAAARRQPARAEALYGEAARLASPDSADQIAARINLARLGPPGRRAAAIGELLRPLAQLPDAHARGHLMLNAGQVALEAGEVGAREAHDAFAAARELGAREPASRMHIAALDGLARLYESAGRRDEAIALGDAATTAARSGALRPVQDLLLDIEWRQGRLWQQAGRADLALAAIARAVAHAQAIRPDLPIETPDGRSSYQAVLQPLLETYVALMLDTVDSAPAERRPVVLASVRDALEAMRQAEMQDFLGDRCTVEEGESGRLDAGTLALYPILLPDRVELLTETREGLRRVTQPASRDDVVATARRFASALRAGESQAELARRLYEVLVRPIEDQLTGMQTLVVVPDGVLRLVPFAALHDGLHPLVERIAVATVTGLSMTSAAQPEGRARGALLAGVAQPGPVVEKLAASAVPGSTRAAGTPIAVAVRSTVRALGAREAQAMRQELALPGVREEIAAIARTVRGQVLLDASFTVQRFQQEAAGGDYRIVHIASHGVFGGSAEGSYILAFDDLLHINRLQGVLQSEKLRQAPIELLTLSACETAEGNDRAPLGIAGAAMRARARSVLGTLWPVDDDAARMLMTAFYDALARGAQGKAAALREAQLALLRQGATQHPFFWAPFTLVGNWR
jgi:CHAT domain-containing protein